MIICSWGSKLNLKPWWFSVREKGVKGKAKKVPDPRLVR